MYDWQACEGQHPVKKSTYDLLSINSSGALPLLACRPADEARNSTILPTGAYRERNGRRACPRGPLTPYEAGTASMELQERLAISPLVCYTAVFQCFEADEEVHNSSGYAHLRGVV